MPKNLELPSDRRATEYLANERTFLAWIRTCIAVISLGFVIARFGVWLRELGSRFDPKAETHGTGFSLVAGIAMMALGSVLTLLAAWRYRSINRSIDCGEYQVDESLVVIVTGSVATLGIVMIAYLFLTAHQF
jgi:putative membrane protein